MHRMGRLDEAVKAYHRAVALNDSYADAHYNLACTYSVEGEFDKCLEELKQAKGLDGLVGKTDPVCDPDLENIRRNPEFGPRFSTLIERERKN